ncbi:MAG: cell division protein FtsQ/DivIB [bacterium]
MRKKRKKFRIRYWIIGFINIIILFFICKGVKKAYRSLMASDCLKIKQIELIGNRRFSKQQILDLADLKCGMNILRIDKKKIRERLTIPWIETCEIKRYFPYVVKICIKEREAMAIYHNKESYLIDCHGYLLNKIEPDKNLNLPRIEFSGDSESKIGAVCPFAQSGVAILAAIRDAYPDLRQELQNIKLFKDDYSVLYVEGYFKKIYLNLHDTLKKLKMLKQMVTKIKEHHEKISYIDLRFKNRIIIGE